DQRQQLLGGFGVALLNGVQDLSHIAHKGERNRLLEARQAISTVQRLPSPPTTEIREQLQKSANNCTCPDSAGLRRAARLVLSRLGLAFRCTALANATTAKPRGVGLVMCVCRTLQCNPPTHQLAKGLRLFRALQGAV